MTETSSRTQLIESFGRRKGRPLTAEKKDLLNELLPQYEISLASSPDSHNSSLSPQEIFPDCTEYWLEIGFGNGEHLVHQLTSNPHIGMIGGEVYTHGIAACLKTLQYNIAAMQRTRFYTDDIRILLDNLSSNSLDKVFILFPDPWPKTKQQKRRLIKQDLLNTLANVMKPNSMLHIATDHHGYGQWIIAHINASPYFQWTAKSESDWLTPPAHHIETRYQQKNKAETDYPIFINATRLSSTKTKTNNPEE